jgi:flagellar motor switch protein FliN/FliY
MSRTTNISASLPSGAPPGSVADSAESDLTPQIRQLPPYSRSLLKIEVPVVVTLATTRMAIARVLDLGPGAILHFEKSYDSPLTLTVGTCEVAVGDAVKIGDKFGIRISSMIMPQEKFEAVRPSAAEPRS